MKFFLSAFFGLGLLLNSAFAGQGGVGLNCSTNYNSGDPCCSSPTHDCKNPTTGCLLPACPTEEASNKSAPVHQFGATTSGTVNTQHGSVANGADE